MKIISDFLTKRYFEGSRRVIRFWYAESHREEHEHLEEKEEIKRNSDWTDLGINFYQKASGIIYSEKWIRQWAKQKRFLAPEAQYGRIWAAKRNVGRKKGHKNSRWRNWDSSESSTSTQKNNEPNQKSLWVNASQ